MLASRSSITSFVKSGKSWKRGTHHNCDETSLEKHGNAHRVGGKQRDLFLVLTVELFLKKKFCNFLGTKAFSDICDHLSPIYSAPIYHLASYLPAIAMATTTTAGRCFDIQNQASSSWDLSPEVSTMRGACMLLDSFLKAPSFRPAFQEDLPC